ncbi:hypothetical protein [Streptomyces sp. ODS28]
MNDDAPWPRTESEALAVQDTLRDRVDPNTGRRPLAPPEPR